MRKMSAISKTSLLFFFCIGAAFGESVSATEIGKIDLNRASLEEIDAVPGIGAKSAQRIVEMRPIRSLDELQDLPGFGAVKVKALREYVTLGDAAKESAAVIAVATGTPKNNPVPTAPAPLSLVTTKWPVPIPIFRDRIKIGQMALPVGTKLPVVSQTTTTVTVRHISGNIITLSAADIQESLIAAASLPPAATRHPLPTPPTATEAVLPLEQVFLSDLWKTPPTQLPGEWNQTAFGAGWSVKAWTNPEAVFGHIPFAATAVFRSGALAFITLSFVDSEAFLTPEEKQFEAQFEAVKNTAPYDAKKATTLWRKLNSQRSEHDRMFRETIGKTLAPTRKGIINALQAAVFRERGFNKIYAKGEIGIVINPGVTSSDSIFVTIFRLGKTDVTAPATGPEGENFLSQKLWDGPLKKFVQAFPENSTTPIFGKPAETTHAENYYDLDAGNIPINRAGSVRVAYLRTIHIGSSGIKGLVEAKALETQFQREKDPQKSAELLTVLKATRKAESTKVVAAHIQACLDYETSLLAELRKYFPSTWENSQHDAPIRFFQNEDFDAELLTTEDKVELRVTRRIEK